MRIFIFFIALHFPSLIFAQKHDWVWIIGDNNSLADTTRGGATIDFNQTPTKAHYHYRSMNMFVCNVSIADSTGKLLFYSNGCDIADANDEILPNGDNINPGEVHQIACIQNEGGYTSNHQSAVILPLPGSTGIYYLFHKSLSITFSPTVVTTDQLLYSIVDMNANEGAGQVIEKNMPIIQDKLAFGEMNAVKHANGVDWWIITPKENSNQYYTFLFTKNGIVDTLIQTVGDIPPFDKEGYGQTIFSPDGSRMIRFFPYTPVMNIFFDRITGSFTNYSTFEVNYGSDFAYEGGCAISPNGRYIYIAALLQVYQFDLWATDIASTQVKVAIWDGFVDPFAISFTTCQLGPDCKIYIVGGGDTRYYHIIHNPDEPGLACNLQQRGLVLPTPSGASIPYFPNYRLGPIDNPGLPCSPVVAAHEPLYFGARALQIYPNPTHESVYLQTLETENTLETVVFDLLGREVLHQSIPNGATLDVSRLPKGLYLIQAMGDSGKRYTGKVRKE